MNGYIVGDVFSPGVQAIRHYSDEVSMLMFSIPLPLTKEKTLTRMVFTFKDYPEGSDERVTAEFLYKHSIGETGDSDTAGFESVDLIVWNNKKYRPKPLLCDGDGPILTWRKYYKQFYAHLDESSPAISG